MANKVNLGFFILVVLILYVNVGGESKEDAKDNTSFVVSLLFYMYIIKYITIFTVNSLYIHTHIYILLFWWSPFIPSRNLDDVFTYNNMAL